MVQGLVNGDFEDGLNGWRVIAGTAFCAVGTLPALAPAEVMRPSWGELHLRLLEQIGPPSILVDAEYDIVHLSPNAGRFLQFAAFVHQLDNFPNRFARGNTLQFRDEIFWIK